MAHIARISTAMLLSGLIINLAKAGPGLNETPSQRMDGLYLGLAGAYETAGVKATGGATGTGGVNDSFNQRIHAQGGAGGLYGGYGAWCDSFYYGVEGSAFLSGLRGKSGFSNLSGVVPVFFNFIAKKTYSFGMTARAGISLGGTLLYAKLGMESAHWKFSFDRLVSNPAFSTRAHRDRQALGIVPGLGVELPLAICTRLRMRVEYSHAFYPKIRLNLAAPIPTNYQGSVKFQPSSHTFIIGVAYGFNQSSVAHRRG